MAGHGAQKLFGWFDGYGLQGTGQFFAENLGLKPGVLMAAMAGGTELIGGILLILGLRTRVSGLALVSTMVVGLWRASLLAPSFESYSHCGGEARASADATFTKGVLKWLPRSAPVVLRQFHCRRGRGSVLVRLWRF